jgi:hypothetical protein
VEILLILITINVMTMALSIPPDLAIDEANYVDIITLKPEWCNSTNLINSSYISLEFQTEYKHPCAQYI